MTRRGGQGGGGGSRWWRRPQRARIIFIWMSSDLCHCPCHPVHPTFSLPGGSRRRWRRSIRAVVGGRRRRRCRRRLRRAAAAAAGSGRIRLLSAGCCCPGTQGVCLGILWRSFHQWDGFRCAWADLCMHSPLPPHTTFFSGRIRVGSSRAAPHHCISHRCRRCRAPSCIRRSGGLWQQRPAAAAAAAAARSHRWSVRPRRRRLLIPILPAAAGAAAAAGSRQRWRL